MKTALTALLGAAVAGVGLALLISLLVSLPVWLLWNGVLVDAITAVQPISWLQAWGIMILCHLLFRTIVEYKKD